ncbi:MAG: nuclear transport factor 2 family protein [Pyrinomonadaceae bacterium]|nr:nuclear transport factor 2 family protein [Pyrinomonadaceae bacterium]
MRRLLLTMIMLASSIIVTAQTNSTPARDVLRVDQDWAALGSRRDAAALTMLDVILADDYTFTGAFGDVITKAEYLKERAEVSYRTEDVRSRVYEHTALVTGHITFESRGTLRRRAPVSFDSVRYTNVYVMQHQKWRLIATQFSPVLKPER